ncbi:MAG: hypothetical protein WC458_00180 [Patescibacteria group bacterium]|jgi:hypothetical protein
MSKEIIKIKETDLKKAAVRAFGRSAWEAGKAGSLKGRIHSDKKRKEPKYKNRFQELEQ